MVKGFHTILSTRLVAGAALLVIMSAAGASTQSSADDALRFSHGDILSGSAPATTNARNGFRQGEIYGRSENRLRLDELGVDPMLRFEFAQTGLRPVDPGIQVDGMTATERAEAGLIDDTSRLYDAGLRFDAARIGDVHFVLRGGVRSVMGGEQTDLANANGMGDLRMAPVAGAGIEWRPRRELWLGGSTLMNVDEAGATLAEITAEMGVDLTRGLSFSLGYRTLESQYNAPSDAAEGLRDAAFAAIRLRF